MDIEDELKKLEHYLPISILLNKVKYPIAYLSEEVTHILPSIIMSADGLTLQSLVIISDRYLCEVPIIGPQSHDNFDYVDKSLIINYRFTLWTQEIKEGDQVKATYDIAQVAFVHGEHPQFRTMVTYAGQERDKWVEKVMSAVPLSLLRGAKKPGSV